MASSPWDRRGGRSVPSSLVLLGIILAAVPALAADGPPSVPAGAPSPLDGLFATPGPGPGQVTLTWDAPGPGEVEVVEYEVRGGALCVYDEEGRLPLLARLDADARAFVVEGLVLEHDLESDATCGPDDASWSPYPLYEFEVSACADSCGLPAGAEARPPTPPTPPTWLKAHGSYEPSQVILEWGPPHATSGLRVMEYRVYADSWQTLTLLGTTNETTFLHAAPQSQTHHYQVKAVTAAGEGDSAHAAADTHAPDEPSFWGEPGPGVGEVTLRWRYSIPRTVSYEIFSLDWDNERAQVAKLGPDARSYVHRPPEPLPGERSGAYELEIAYVEDDDLRTTSVVGGGLPFRAPAAPSIAPHGHLSWIQGLGQVTLEWLPIQDEAGPVEGHRARIYRDEVDGQHLVTEVELPKDALSHTFRGLPTRDELRGILYWVEVVAWNKAGEGAVTGVHATPMPGPSAPRNVTAVPGDEEGSVRIAWEPPRLVRGHAIVSYGIHRWEGESSGPCAPARRSCDGTWRPIATVPAGERDHTDVERPSHISHGYVVTASTRAGEGEPSEMALVFPSAGQHDEHPYDELWGDHGPSGGGDGTSGDASGDARTRDGNGRKSPAASCLVPQAPTGFAARVSAPTSSANLSWGPPSVTGSGPVLGYWVFMGDSPQTLQRLAYPDRMMAREVAVTIADGRPYHYGVAATNSCGLGELAVRGPVTVPPWSGPPEQAPPPPELAPTPTGRLPGADAGGGGGGAAFPEAGRNAGTPSSPLDLVLRVDGARDEAILGWAPPASSGAGPITGYVVLRGRSSETLVPVQPPLPADARGLTLPRSQGEGDVYAVGAVNAAGLGELAIVSATAEEGPARAAPVPGASFLALAAGLGLVAALRRRR